jgi:hypothetical protein
MKDYTLKVVLPVFALIVIQSSLFQEINIADAASNNSEIDNLIPNLVLRM